MGSRKEQETWAGSTTEVAASLFDYSTVYRYEGECGLQQGVLTSQEAKENLACVIYTNFYDIWGMAA